MMKNEKLFPASLVVLLIAVTVLAYVLAHINTAKPTPSGATSITYHDDESDADKKQRHFEHQVFRHATLSMLKDVHVLEIYPELPGKLWRSHDDEETIRIEVQRSHDGAINGKTRYRSYTWKLVDVTEEER